jgi:AraC-like DNA-binding protein
MAIEANHDLAATNWREFLVSRLTDRRRCRQARTRFKIRRRSVSSAAPRIAFQQAEGARRAFQRGYLQAIMPPEDLMVQKLNCSFGVFSTLIRRGTKYQATHRQAKHDSRNLTNITTGVTHRQLNFAASHKKETDCLPIFGSLGDTRGTPGARGARRGALWARAAQSLANASTC